MNRKEWFKNSGIYLAGGLSIFSGEIMPRLKSINDIKISLKSSRKFVSDFDFMRTMPSDKNIIRLMANENPWGPSKRATDAILSSVKEGNRYAFSLIDNFKTKIAKYENISLDQILLSPGSSNILTGAAIYNYQIGGNIIAAEPSYSDMPDFAEEIGCEVRWVPLDSEFKLDLDAMEKNIDENTSMVYICNPNNPTGTKLKTSELRDFCVRTSRYTNVFVDEAYLEYQENPKAESMIDLVNKGLNITILRTFSKVYGMAGIRMGYAVSGKDMIEKLKSTTRSHQSLTVKALSGASEAFQETEFLYSIKKKTSESREYLYSILRKEGYEYIPSSTNFVMFPINMEGERFVQEMWKRGVGVRSWEFNNQDWCRVSLGTMENMQFFEKAFKQIS